MFSFKKLILTAALVSGFCGLAQAADRIEGSWAMVESNTKTTKKATASVGGVHSVAVNSGAIKWQVDVRIQGAKGRECVICVELCNAAGQTYINRDGSPIQLFETVTPDTDSYHATDLDFQLSDSRFWTLYGRSAKELTFRVIVIDDQTGKTLSSSTVMSLNGLGTKLPPAPPEKTDLPTINPGRFGNVWMRLMFA